MKAVVIDSKRRVVYETTFLSQQLRRLIGGPATLVHDFPNGDELYCDDSGIALADHFCWLPATPLLVYGGRLAVLGRALDGAPARGPGGFVSWEPGAPPTNADPATKPEELAQGIRWMTFEEVQAFTSAAAGGDAPEPPLD